MHHCRHRRGGGGLALPGRAQNLPRQKLELAPPPFVHAHEQATQQGPKILEVRLFTQEKELVIDNEGTKLQAMTFNGSIPGPAIVVHQGDYVELTLANLATTRCRTTSISTPPPARWAAAT